MVYPKISRAIQGCGKGARYRSYDLRDQKLEYLSFVFQVSTFQTRVMSYDWILVGRFINGMGCGVAAAVSPVYLAEIAPLHLRGALGASYSLL